MKGMKNQEIAEIFKAIADILEIGDENPFRIRAYRKAAQNIEGLTEDIETLTREKKLNDIPGVGTDLAGKIEEYIRTGAVKAYEDLKKTASGPALELMAIPGVGPKTAKLLFDKLKIKSIIIIYLPFRLNIFSPCTLFVTNIYYFFSRFISKSITYTF